MELPLVKNSVESCDEKTGLIRILYVLNTLDEGISDSPQPLLISTPSVALELKNEGRNKRNRNHHCRCNTRTCAKADLHNISRLELITSCSTLTSVNISGNQKGPMKPQI
jgi:hypothetical protein